MRRSIQLWLSFAVLLLALCSTIPAQSAGSPMFVPRLPHVAGRSRGLPSDHSVQRTPRQIAQRGALSLSSSPPFTISLSLVTGVVGPAPGEPLPAGPVTLVALGDSLTAGDGDNLELGGYPGRLIDLVRQRRADSRITNLGRSGWNSDALINGDQGLPGQLGQAEAELRAPVEAGHAAVALVWIGSNDLWYLYDFGVGSDSGDAEDLAHYTANLDTILGRLRAIGARVVVALLDDQSQRPVAVSGAYSNITAEELVRMSQQVARYNAAIEASAAQHGARTVDFYHTTIFTDPATLADDGNHPNAAGYDQVTQIWLATLDALFGS